MFAQYLILITKIYPNIYLYYLIWYTFYETISPVPIGDGDPPDWLTADILQYYARNHITMKPWIVNT